MMQVDHLTHSQVWQTCLHVWHDACIYVTWRIHMCDMMHSWWGHDVLIYVTWLIHAFDMTHMYIWHDYIYMYLCCMTRYICDMTPSSGRIMTIYICDMTHSYIWHDFFMCETWLIYLGESHAWLWRDMFLRMTWRLPNLAWGTYLTNAFVRCRVRGI